MTLLDDRIVHVDPATLDWSLDGERTWPRFRPPVPSVRYVSMAADPFPAYAHRVNDLELTAHAVERAYPLPEEFRPWYVLSPWEDPGRTNASTHREFDYDAEPPEGVEEREWRSQRPWTSWILFGAKRIPPHPAMTRYLAAHEYGHVVNYWLERRAGIDEGGQDLDDEYRAVRGLAAPTHYGGGTWHLAVGELIANDFRVLVTGVEADYWPHPGIERPERVAGLDAWWAEAVLMAAHER